MKILDFFILKSLSLLFCISLLMAWVHKKSQLPSNIVILNTKKGIYFDEHEIIIKDLDSFISTMKKSLLKYRMQRYLGKYFLQVNNFLINKFQCCTGQRGFYRFLQMNGRLFLIDALETIYIVNKDPKIFIDQIKRNVEDAEIHYIKRKIDVQKIILEIHDRAHQMIHYARNISEYVKFNSMYSKIYVLKDNLISLHNINEISKNGPDVGIFLIVWGDENQYINFNKSFNRIFIFKGEGLMGNDVLNFNECLYMRNSFVQRIIIGEEL